MLNPRTFNDVTLYPWERDESARLKFRLGAYLGNGSFLDEFRLVRNWGHSDDCPWDASRPTEAWPGEHVYGGILFDHYGHFLLESLSRITSFRPGVPIVWHVAFSGAKDRGALFPWQQAVFDVLGVETRDFRFVRSPAVRIEQIQVAPPGYVIQLEAQTGHMERLARFPASAVVPGRKLWLSRTKLFDKKRRTEGELELERRLAEVGWDIYSPERHPILEQLHHMSSAEVLGGFIGSAFHTLILARDVATRFVIVTKGGEGNGNYATIARVTGLKQQIVKTRMEAFSEGGTCTRNRLRDMDTLITALCAAAEAPTQVTT
jgi:hypothetical protein